MKELTNSACTVWDAVLPVVPGSCGREWSSIAWPDLAAVPEARLAPDSPCASTRDKKGFMPLCAHYNELFTEELSLSTYIHKHDMS